MRPEDRDMAYLWDMREAAQEIVAFMKDIPYVKFEKNHVIRYATERQLMVIGEAANHVSEEFRMKHPEIPWMQIIGQRNVLAHEYGEILVERIWLAATKSVPELLKSMKALVPDE